MQERRVDSRLLCADLVETIWQDASGHPQRHTANLEDISLCGICLQAETHVPTGTRISMCYGDGELIGTVRYCVFRDSGYFLGIEFQEGCRWSTQHFRPQHLVDPRELVEQAMRRHLANFDVRNGELPASAQ